MDSLPAVARVAGPGATLLLLATSLAAQTTAGFVTRLGNDTVAVERYEASPTVIRGISVSRVPSTRVARYDMTLAHDGTIDRLHIAVATPGGRPLAEVDYRYFDDSVVLTQKRDTLSRTMTIPVTGRPLPFSNTTVAGWEVVLQHLHGGHMRMLAGREPLDYAVTRLGNGEVRLITSDHDYSPLEARLGANGRLQEFDFRGTTDKYLATRVADVDVEGLAARFAAADQAGHGLGTLSPRDTARAQLGGARVMVDYGRPSARGRVIFGNVVRWGQVWRLGANEATQLITDRDLVIEGATVPAGSYSLWAIPNSGGWKLVINKQHGQWGTEYHPEQDLARVPMQTSRLSDPVERMTVRIDLGEQGGAIVVRWADTEARVAVTARGG